MLRCIFNGQLEGMSIVSSNSRDSPTPPPHLSSSITSLLCSSADLACQLLIQHLASAYLGFYPPSIEWKIMQIPLKWTVMDDTGKEIVQKSQ